MKICVCGWYYEPRLMDVLREVNSRYPVTIIAHKPPEKSVVGLQVVETANVGLEFGAYDHYLKQYWDGENSVLFMHDDVDIVDASAFDNLAAIAHDQAFVFRDEADGKANQNFHGRMFFCSEKFLKAILAVCNCHQATDRIEHHHNHFCSRSCADDCKQVEGWDNDVVLCTYKENQEHKRCVGCGEVIDGPQYWATILRGQGPHTGFWFDRDNCGHNRGRPPVGIRHYNDAIYHFALQCSRLRSDGGLDSRNVVYLSKINLYKRGVPK